jgi:hypothetical protein
MCVHLKPWLAYAVEIRTWWSGFTWGKFGGFLAWLEENSRVNLWQFPQWCCLRCNTSLLLLLFRGGILRDPFLVRVVCCLDALGKKNREENGPEAKNGCHRED